jgi:hypothetical protein
MTFTIGQSVRCTSHTLNRTNVQFGEEFTVSGVDGNRFISLQGNDNAIYDSNLFEPVLPPVTVRSTVTCIDARRSYILVEGRQYVVWDVRDDKYLINGSWVKASRFKQTAGSPVVRPYALTLYHGCCGAGIIFFGNELPTEDRVKKTIEMLSLPGYVCVLNGLQQKASGAMLEANGFKFVGKTASRSGRQYPLYHYLYTKIEAELPPERVTEAPRVF